jgi:hypothetical protein
MNNDIITQFTDPTTGTTTEVYEIRWSNQPVRYRVRLTINPGADTFFKDFKDRDDAIAYAMDYATPDEET